MRGFRVAFYGFVKLLCDPVHILKLFDEALRVGRSGAKCRMFYVDGCLMLRRYGSEMQKFVCFWMGRELFARGAKRKSKSKIQGYFPFGKLRVRMTSKRRGDDERSGMGRSTSVLDVSVRGQSRMLSPGVSYA